MDNNFIAILGVAHSDNVAGKQSPDGRHHEPVWSKAQLHIVKSLLDAENINNVVAQMESDSLAGRIAFVNKVDEIARNYKKAVFLSLHNNAAGMGLEWMSATGWCIYTSKGETKSDLYANKLWYELKAAMPGLYARYNNEAQRDYEENFTVLMGKNYYAILLEWLFQDNKDDLLKIENADICSKLREVLVTWFKNIKEEKYDV